MRLKILIIFFLIIASWKPTLSQQEQNAIQLSGLIKDTNNRPLPFATIVVEQRFQGTVSDQRGMFSFIVFPNDTVRFSSVGFKSQQLVIPDKPESFHYSVDVRLETDTIELAEVTIFRYGTYEEFRQAIINLRLPDDYFQRALANLELIQSQIYSDTSADAALNYKHFMNEQHFRAMHRGQLPPNNLLNPFAWAQFIQAVRDGRFRR